MDNLLRELDRPERSALAADYQSQSSGVRPSRRNFIALIALLDESLFPFLLLLSLLILITSVIPTYYVSFYPQVLFHEIPRKECLKLLSPKDLDFCIGGFKWNG